MEIIYTIASSFWCQSLIRLMLGFVLASVIGLERSSWNKPAGFKTHCLVSVSAVLVMLCGQYMAMEYDIDPSRIAAQLLSGIGFIGAGTILRQGFDVRGLTTAASLLAVTCIGLTIGAGFYVGGIIGTLIVYLILSYSYVLSDKVKHENIINIEITTKKDIAVIVPEIEKTFDIYQIRIKNIKSDKDDEDEKETEKPKEYTINIIGEYITNIKKNELITKIASLKGIKEVKEEE